MRRLGSAIADYLRRGLPLQEAIQPLDPAMVELSAGGSRIECARLAGEELAFVLYWKGSDGELGTSDDISVLFDASK